MSSSLLPSAKKEIHLKKQDIPPNVLVADWIPFDALLPHVDVFVTNGGYGAYLHAISNGTPLVVGGDGEDKPEVPARAEYAGMGINLKTGTPTIEAIRNAVNKVLGDEKYKNRCKELQQEQANTDALGFLSGVVQEMA